jgi:hypothetical protein
MCKSRKSSVKKLSVSLVRSESSLSPKDAAKEFLGGMKKEEGILTPGELVDVVRVLGYWSCDQYLLASAASSDIGRHYLCIKLVEALSQQFEVQLYGTVVYELMDSELTHKHLLEVCALLSHMVSL